MDNLISRKAALELLGEPHPLDHNAIADVQKIIALPSVPAVPMEMISKKLGSLCKPCIFQIVGCPHKSFDCDSCNTSDAWEKAIIKWMEEQDAQKEN